MKVCWKFKAILVVLFFQSAPSLAGTLTDFILEKIDRIETQEILQDFRSLVLSRTDRNSKVTSDLQKELNEVDEQVISKLDPKIIRKYEAIWAEIGAKVVGRVPQMSANSTPFWHRHSQNDPLTSFRSSEKLPSHADYVVIGAGLTGSAAAYFLLPAVKSGKSVVVIDSGSPASQASGRNGGNFQLLPETYRSSYEGFVEERYKWLLSKSPHLGEAKLRGIAEKEADILFRFSYENLKLFTQIVENEKLACDFSPNGWLRIPATLQEETAILKEIDWFRSKGAQMEVLSPEEIQTRFGISTAYSGRFIPKNGNYHPQKFVYELLQKSIQQGVQLYTGVRVLHIASPNQDGTVKIETAEGSISAGKVIVATNAFTPQLVPELKAIECVPSQENAFEHVPDPLNGATVTSQNGDIYFNFPKQNRKDGEGTLLYGYDFETSVPDPENLVLSEEIYQKSRAASDAHFPETQGQPPSATWIGPMAVTPDRVPVIGFMNPHVVVAAAFQGYGGSFCIKAGSVAAKMALTGETDPVTPASLFGPERFLEEKNP